MVLLWGFLSFLSLVISLLAFRRSGLVMGWLGIAGFIIFMTLAALSLWGFI